MLRITTGAARELQNQLGEYLDMVDSSGEKDDAFECRIEAPITFEPKAVNDVRVKLAYSPYASTA